MSIAEYEVESGETANVKFKGKRVMLEKASIEHIRLYDDEPIYVYIEIYGIKRVAATLNLKTRRKQFLDLMLDKPFQISHTLKQGCVYFSTMTFDDDEKEETSKEEEKVKEAATAETKC